MKKKTNKKKSLKSNLKLRSKSNLKTNMNSLKLNQEIWPLERDIFFRPGRMKYVRKIIRPDGCVFCNSAQQKQSLETLCLFKSKYSQVVVNKFPYNNGHLLVLPLRHCGHLLELSEEEYLDLHLVLKKAFAVLQSVYSPQGFNIGMNHGATGGAGIPDHLHYHIVPRWHGDLNFFPLIAETKLVIEDIKTTYKRLKGQF